MATPLDPFRGYGKIGGQSLSEKVDARIKKRTQELIELRRREAQYLDYHARNQPNNFNIEPMPFERQRLDKVMTAEERLFRKQWVKDQVLSPNEPRYIPECHPRNIFKRIWHTPFDTIQKVLQPVTGKWIADRVNNRGRVIVAIYLGVLTFYYMTNYSYPRDWKRTGGIMVLEYKAQILPCDPQWPTPACKKGHDFHDFGFSERTTHRFD